VFHSALRKSPFEVLYGRTPRHFAVHTDTSAAKTDVEVWLKEREATLPVIKQHLERAQRRMQTQADKNQSEREFAVGDQVYLCLQPYVQTLVAARSSQKLGFKYFGPYLVLQRVGKVAYKLQLPPTARIHLVVHVSQLKKAVKSTDEVSTSLPLAFLRVQMNVQPEQLLSDHMLRRGGNLTPQVRIKWAGLPDNCASWEPLFAMVDKFPDAPAWGQAASAGEGNVTHHHLVSALGVTRRRVRHQEIRKTQRAKAQMRAHGRK
jgi:hypothetical protein